MNDDHQQDNQSESGIPIYRHQTPENQSDQQISGNPFVEQIENHIQTHVGPIANVFHEIISELVHLDVYIVEPTLDKNFYTLITSGMSARPMAVPEGAEEFRYGELLINLPPDWKINQEDFKSEENYGPLRLLKFLARLPHQYGTWLSYYHTIPNGDPPAPFTSNTGFSGAMLIAPLIHPEQFSTLKIDEKTTIYFYSLLPLYTEEMNIKLRSGTKTLIQRLQSINTSDLIDLSRPNVGIE